MEAKDLAWVHRQYALAIILFEIAVETFLQEHLLSICKRTGRTKIEPKGKLREGLSLEQAIDKFSVRELIPAISEILGYNIKESSEYRNWHHNTYQRRNRIIHTGQMACDDQEATLALASSTEFINSVIQATNRVLVEFVPLHAK